MLEGLLAIDLVSFGELLLDLFKAGAWALAHPFVPDHVHHRWSIVRLVGEHKSDQVLKVCIEEAFRMVVCVCLPELCGLVLYQHAVVDVGGSGHVKGWMAGVQREQDHPHGKHVHLGTHVRLAFVKLRCHVCHSTYNSIVESCTIVAADVSSETHVDDLDVVAGVEQNIDALEVSVGEPFCMHVVHSLQELLHVETDHRCTEST